MVRYHVICCDRCNKEIKRKKNTPITEGRIFKADADIYLDPDPDNGHYEFCKDCRISFNTWLRKNWDRPVGIYIGNGRIVTHGSAYVTAKDPLKPGYFIIG